MKSGILAREGESVCLASDTFEDSKRAYLTGRELLALKLEVLYRELYKISNLELLRDVFGVIVLGHSLSSLYESVTKALA